MPVIQAPNSELSIEFSEEHRKEFGPCECCGENTTRVWGYVQSPDRTRAAYFVEWNPSHNGEAVFDFIFGDWGENSHPNNRRAATVLFRNDQEAGPGFMVGNASDRPVAKSPLVGKALHREDVIGTDVAPEIFELCDAVYLSDPRLTFVAT